jgi:hypothetical protein
MTEDPGPMPEDAADLVEVGGGVVVDREKFWRLAAELVDRYGRERLEPGLQVVVSADPEVHALAGYDRSSGELVVLGSFSLEDFRA